MARALQLAARGLHSTQPNPRVGCVLARDGQVLAEGWHQQAGAAHAEAAALQALGGQATGATAYVTLEPCSHHGRTPPCAGALVAAGVAEVVVAMGDPNPQVNGQGLEVLQAAGIKVRSGLLEAAARELNPGFIMRMEQGRPWVRVKIAQSLDGRIALGSGESQWITGRAARADVQQWRGRASAVMTGIGTLLADDPSLNLRLPGALQQPVRVVVDSHWRTPTSARTLGLPGQVIIAGLESSPVPAGLQASSARLLALPGEHGRVSLPALLKALAGQEVNELQVEAGGTLCAALLEARCVDELLIYQAACLLGSGGLASFALPAVAAMDRRPAFTLLEQRSVGADLRMRLRPQY
jgi:diaminohydroxyphosphoribosylaminopyrimidine deaminase/5-amino-6-(5-phosphoribosylamino)uracil reductase